MFGKAFFVAVTVCGLAALRCGLGFGETPVSDDGKPEAAPQAGGISVQHAMEPGTEVHQWIAWQAFLFYDSQFEGSELAQYLVGADLTPQSNWNMIAASTHLDGDDNVLEGTADEDIASERPFPSGLLTGPTVYHFCAGGDGA
ncbi:MAG TPA: hypothetical protein VM487_08145, partial [Phycisphaerae bacterium]|nr:hypothetical protein [Phycisphaerae bacterium]